MTTTIFSYLTTKLDQRRSEIVEHIALGGLKEMTDYHKLCGFIQGLEFAKELTLDLSKRMDNDDE